MAGEAYASNSNLLSACQGSCIWVLLRASLICLHAMQECTVPERLVALPQDCSSLLGECLVSASTRQHVKAPAT